MFVSGHTGSFRYLLAPEILHLIIKASSAIIVIFSTLAILKRPASASRGLEYTVFFILAMLLPQYCIYYTWAWLFVFYYAVFTYAGYPGVPQRRKQLLLICAYAMFFSSLFIGFDPANRASNFFWSTLILWAGIIGVLFRERREESAAAAK
jgi:hypothetical protein